MPRLLVVLMSCAPMAAAAAQGWRPTFSLEAGGGSSTLVVHEYTPISETIRYVTGRESDVGGRVAFRFLSVGIGYRRFAYTIAPDSNRSAMGGVVISPRLALPGLWRVRPFIEGDFGRLAERNDVLFIGPFRLDDRVSALGGRAGLLVRISRALSLDVSATYRSLSFHDFTVDDVPFPGTSKNGEHAIDGRLGVSYLIGR